jgi:integrase
MSFKKFIQHLSEPFGTIALVCVCFDLRISECLALKWSDIDWLNGKLRVQRAIVKQRVDDVKTAYSQRLMTIDADMLGVLKTWKQAAQFSGQDDWVFASPVRLGRTPWSYDRVLDSFVERRRKPVSGHIGTHSMRHTYRSWLDAVGTALAVQQKLMRHADIRTTMNIYGDVVTNEMAQAHGKIVGLALNRAQTERKPS